MTIDRNGKYPYRIRGKVCVGMATSDPKPLFISKRQHDVFCGIANNETTIGTAIRLGISPKTVEYHRSVLLLKLGPKYQGIAAITKLALKLRLVKNDA